MRGTRTRGSHKPDLQELLRFETLLTDLSASFVSVAPEEVDREIERWLRRMVEFLDIERSILFQFSDEEKDFRITHSYAKADFTPALPVVPREEGPWYVKKMLAGETVVLSRLDDLPAGAARDKETTRRFGVKSAVMIPLKVGGTVMGAMTFDALRRERSWPDDVVRRFGLVGEVFANALARKRAQVEREELLRFEDLVARLSATFIHVPVHAVDGAIEEALRLTAEFLGVDRATVYEFSEDRTVHRTAHMFAAPGVPRAPAMFRGDEVPWFMERMLSGLAVAVRRPGELADEAWRERDYLASAGIKALAAVPLALGGSILGAVGWTALRAGREWPEALIQRLHLVGEVFANALGRKRAEEALRKSEFRFRRALEAAPEGILLVRQDGVVAFANDQAGGIFGYAPEDLAGLHVDELVPGRFRSAHAQQRQEFQRARGSREIGTRRSLYGLRKDGTEVPVEIGLSPLETPDGPLVYCSVRDVTERRHLEAETRRLQMQLWHADRVAQTGALTGSLAHELNQPLAAILSNAQAGLRFLARDNPDLEEIRAILSDIVRDDKRAGAVISGLRSMLRQQEAERVRVDLAGTLGEMLELLNSELLTHQVEVDTDFESGCTVLADKAQLQQVVLNLAMNAIEAMREQPAGARRLALSVARAGEGQVQVAVRDAGVGIPAEKLATVFDAFWTTKAQGMGLGLAICRSIVESHGGAIWVEANQDRGVTFYFRLPVEGMEGLGDGGTGPSGGSG